MIFLTVGAQMPFDRLIRTVDSWVASVKRTDVFAQIGRTAYRPRHFEWVDFLDPSLYLRRMHEANLIVTHAGMGSIITAREMAKPILVMPRRADLGETRNDHQFGTARRFREDGAVTVAGNPDELIEHLSRLEEIPPTNRVSSHASACLLSTLREFIDTGKISILPGLDPAMEPPASLPFPQPPVAEKSIRNRTAA